MMNRTLVFDMDGTIANLYGVNGWLNDLRTESDRPYRVAEPMYKMDELNSILNELKSKGWKIVVTTWLAKDATKEYDNIVRVAKRIGSISSDFRMMNCIWLSTELQKPIAQDTTKAFRFLSMTMRKSEKVGHLDRQ